jgi:hypothetical protein
LVFAKTTNTSGVRGIAGVFSHHLKGLLIGIALPLAGSKPGAVPFSKDEIFSKWYGC